VQQQQQPIGGSSGRSQNLKLPCFSGSLAPSRLAAMADDKENQPRRTLYPNESTKLFGEDHDVRECQSNGDASSETWVDGCSDAIRVVLRVRPLTPAEHERSQRTCLELDSATNSVLIGTNNDLRRFTYDHVASPEVDQAQMFYLVGRPIADSALDGYNGTVFAYGQTGSGKTYTMQGDVYTNKESEEKDNRGLMPRLFEYIFAQIARREREHSATRYLVRCSYLEVYNEVVTDLLDPLSTNLAIREDFRNGVSVEGLSEELVSNADDCLHVLERGLSNRHIGSTSMNRESSRSHSVFIMVIESETTNETRVTTRRRSRLNLVDLAGSERQKLARTSGQTLREAGNINKSLSALGNVINALVDIANGKERHIHYRDSKLTFLLKDSLGGNTKTTMIATVSPSEQNFAETLSTLKFAQRAKYIKNKVVVNEHLSSNNIAALQAEITRLRQLVTSAGIPVDADVSKVGWIVARQSVPGIDCEKMHLQRIGDLERLLLEALDRARYHQEQYQALEQQNEALNTACRKRDKVLQQNKMILRLRDAALERVRSSGEVYPTSEELLKEIEILREQIEHHPQVTSYAVENMRLQERIRVLESLVPADQDQSAFVKLERFVEQLRIAYQACCEEKNSLHKKLHELVYAELEPLDQAEKTHNRFIALELYKWREKERFEQQVEEARSECRQAMLKYEHAQRELETLRTKFKQVEQAYEEKRAACVEMETALSTLRLQHDKQTDIEQKILILSDELRESRERCQSLETDAAALEQECDRLRAVLNDTKDRLQHTETEKEALEQQRNQLEKRLEQLEKDGQHVRQEAAERAQAMEAAHNAALTDLESRLANVQMELESQLERNCALQDQIDQLQSETDYHRGRYQEAQRELANAQEQVKGLESKLAQSNATVEELRASQCQQAASHDEQLRSALRQQRSAETALQQERETLHRLQSDHEQLLARHETIQQELRESRDMIQRLRVGMQAAQHEAHAQQEARLALERRVTDLEQERAQGCERVATLEQDLTSVRQRADEASTEAAARISELIQELERKHSALTRAQLALAETVAKADLERKQLADEHAERLRARDRLLAQSEVETAKLRQEIENLQASVAEYRNEQRELHRLAAQERQQRKMLEDDWEKQRRQYARDMDALRKRLEAAESETRMRCDAQADAQREIACIRQQAEAYQQQLAHAEKHRAQLENRLVMLERDKQRLVAENRHANEALIRAQAQFEALEREHRQTSEALEKERVALASLQTEFEQLQIICERLEEENTKLGGHHNLRQRIHHHIRVKEENAVLRKERDRIAAELDACRARLAELENAPGTS